MLMTSSEKSKLIAIDSEPGQYFVMDTISWSLLKKKLIWTDSGGYLRITEEGELTLKEPVK